MRLTSKRWATLGEDYLLCPGFIVLPYRDDMSRLLSISRHPRLPYRIQSLSLNLGETNEYHARNNIFSRTYMRIDRAKLNEEALVAYKRHQILEEKYISAFSVLPDVKRVLLGLPNLESISVSLTTCPFQDPELYPETLRQIWTTPSARLLPRTATISRFMNLLTAITFASSISTIRTLSHDRLPFEFFDQRPLFTSLISTSATAFQSLTSLNLTVDYKDLYNDSNDSLPTFQNLSYCLRSASKLHTLLLAFQSKNKISISSILASFQEHHFSWPELEALMLEGISTTEEELGDFLVQQTSLRRMRLGGAGVYAWHESVNGGVHLLKGSFQGLFARIEAEMKLEKFELMGDCVGKESGEKWLLDVADKVQNLKEYVLD